MELSIEEIKEIIPHREPFLLIDKITDLVPGQEAKGQKLVKKDDPWTAGHFPGQPIMPGVLIIEALAQTGAVAILSDPDFKGQVALLGGIKNARFKNRVVPGDTLELHAKIIGRRGPLGMAEAVATVEGKICCKTEITFGISKI